MENQGIMGSYMRGYNMGKNHAKQDADFMDLTGLCPYFKDGYVAGYRA